MMRIFQNSLFLVWVLVIASCSQQHHPPNVILIITDDQGYGDFGCNGNPWLQTPHMDALAAEGVNLQNFHVDPTCAPTRAALMTGRYSARVGVWKTFKGRHHLAADEHTMADVFSANGYNTTILGKWHLGDNYPFRPMDRGFNESLIHGGGVIGEAPDYWGNNYYDDVFFRNGEPEQTDGYCTDLWFREAREFISRQEGQPFFLYLALNSPHGPLHVPHRYVKPYLGQEGIPEKRAWLYGMIASIDENLGDFTAFLEESGVKDNTILIFMSDNGTSQGVQFRGTELVSGYNAGMRGRKTSPYEGGHRGTFILNWPAAGYEAGVDVEQLTAHLDVLPTLMDLAGLEYPEEIKFDGRSFAPLLETASRNDWEDRHLVVHNQIKFGVKEEHDRPVKYRDYAVMSEQWRLVGKELYDIKADPSQNTDISADHPEVAARLAEVYELWWEDVDGLFHSYQRTVIDPSKQEEVQLDCQFWHGERAMYSQQQVRAGWEANGFWDLEIAEAGSYEITLRRWPRELDLAIADSVPRPSQNPELSYGKEAHYLLPSAVVPAVKARLRVGDFEMEQEVRPGQKEVVFRVELPAGDTELQSWLSDEEGREWGAYYVYIRPN